MEERRTALVKANGSSKEEYVPLEIDVILLEGRDIITDSTPVGGGDEDD